MQVYANYSKLLINYIAQDILVRFYQFPEFGVRDS